MITPVNQRTRIGPQPKDYNKDLTCEYHQGEVGHAVENCRVLRHRIQDLLDQGVLKFRIEGVINTIGAEKDEEVDITSTKIPWEPLFHELKKARATPCTKGTKRVDRSRHVPVSSRGSRPQPTRMRRVQEGSRAGLITKGLIRRKGEQPERDCMTIDQLRLSPYEKTNFQARMERIEEDFEKFCERKKEELGKLTPATPLEMSGPDPVVIRYVTKEKVVLQTASVSAVQSSEKVPSVVIQVPQPFPYQDSKKIPWNYGMKVISTRESQPKTKEEVVGNLTSGLGGITRSGRCYTPEELEKRRKEAGKAVEDPVKTKAAEEGGRRFPPNHQEKALLKVLNEAYVPEDITGPSFENMVTSILVTNQLTFSDDELPPEGRGHTKALYISVKTNDRVVSRVLIDNGSALNVCPLSTLEKLDIDPTRVRVNSMVVRAFDGTRREVLGEIDLPVEIGPQVYDINFQVLRIDSPYNLLLGRPWLHTAGAVPSSLHQKMKLIIGNQLVTILAEEPISIYNDGEIPYIDGCAPEEASFHSFEFVTVIHRVAAVEPRLSKAGIMVAKEFVKAGFQPGQGMDWGIPRPEGIVRWPMKPGGKELQRSSKERNGLRGRIAIPHIRTTFPASAMFQVDEGDVDELALLFTEDLNVNAITTEGDSAAFPVHADQHEEIDLEDFLDEENLKGYRIDEETLDEDTWEDDDLPDLLPHLMVPRGLDTLELRDILRAWRPGISSTELKNLACWGDLAKAFLDRYRHNIKAPPPNLITTAVAEEEDAGPMVEGLSIHTIAGEEDSTTTPPTRHCQQGEEANEGEEPREVKIGTRCAAEQKEALIALLREFHEIFAWSYQDMPGLDTDIVVHKIPLKPECKPVKQALRRMKPEVILKIKEEVEKQLKAATNVVFSFMDGFSGYNQIKMAEEDKSKTAFVTHWGTFVYDVMPFGLKNAGATYQRAMVTLFHDMIHHEIEKYQLRLNPNKCAFGVTSGKLLGFIVSGRGIEIDPAKVQAIRSMPAPRTEKEIRSFLGRINYIARFIAQLTATCEPLFKLLRKDVKIKWTEDCQKAFDKIKEYLLNPPILVPPTPGRPLILYLTVQEASMGCMLGQQDETGKKEQAIYYLSKKFTEPETRYLLVEKTCCALGLGLQEAETVHALLHHLVGIPDGPESSTSFEKPALTGKIARWQVLLSEFDILFVARKAIKGQAIADYLADYPSEQLELNGLRRNAVGSGIGAVLVSPKGQQTPIAVKLGFDCTNNMTEYEACIVGLQAALEFGAYELEVFGDSLLIVSQTNGEWQARDPKLIPYQRYISRLVPKFKYVTFTYTPRAHNHFADALATLASLIKLVEGDDVRPLRIETRDIPAYCVCIEECMNVEAEIDDKPCSFLSGEILYKRTHDATLLRCVDAEEANRLIPRDARGINGSPCQRTLPGPEDHESWLLLVDNGEGLHQTCPDVPQMPDVSEQQERTSPISSHYGLAVAVLSLGNGCDRCELPQRRLTGMSSYCYASSSRFQHHNSAPYRPKMNGAVEAANKNVKKILSKMTETYKDWHEHLPYALCAYRTSVRTSVGATPYSLVYGMEAVLPVEVEIPSLRILSQTQLEEAEWAQAPLYQRRIERAYNKKARPRTFQPGDLVLKKRNMALSDPRGKFAPSYEGPYVVKKAFSGGAIILADMDGEEFRSPINSDSVIKYHV
uniref:Uncharacterized protein n=1 Tax=Fagus sylvatica TaxID=28930 RepID=A0A2N9FRR6_FAGSY